MSARQSLAPFSDPQLGLMRGGAGVGSAHDNSKVRAAFPTVKASEVRQEAGLSSGGRQLFGVEILPVDEHELVAELLASGAGGRGWWRRRTSTKSTLFNHSFRDAYGSAWRVTTDGAPVFAYAPLAGIRLPACPRGRLVCDARPGIPPRRAPFVFRRQLRGGGAGDDRPARARRLLTERYGVRNSATWLPE